MLNLTIKERKSKFNKLSDSLNIKLIEGCKKDIQYMVHYINNDKKLKTKLIDLNNKRRCKVNYMIHCGELPYGILSYSSYIDPETIRVVSCCRKKRKQTFKN